MSNGLKAGSKNFNISTWLIVICGGVVLGGVLLAYVNLGARWMVSCTMALLILAVGMCSRNPKLFFLALFSFALPINAVNYIGVLSSAHTGGPPGFYNAFLDFPLIALFILCMPKIFISKTLVIRFTKLDLCIFGIILMSYLSMYNAMDTRLCLYSIVQLVKMYLIFFYFSRAIVTKDEIKFIILFILAGVFFESLVGILQHVRGDALGLTLLGGRQDMKMFSDLSRVSGTLGHPNRFAAYLICFLPLTAVSYFAPVKPRYKVMCSAIFLAGVAALVFSLSRGAWISFLISMSVLLFLGYKARIITAGKVAVIAILAVLMVSVIVISFQDMVSTRLFADDYGSAWSRIPQIKVALNAIRSHPFLGVGINNYSEVMHMYDNTAERITGTVTYGLHNSYLLIASEIGIIGLCLFLLFAVSVLRRALKTVFRGEQFIAYAVLGFLAGASAFLMTIIIDPIDMVSPIFVSFWMVSGLLVAMAGISDREIATALGPQENKVT